MKSTSYTERCRREKKDVGEKNQVCSSLRLWQIERLQKQVGEMDVLNWHSIFRHVRHNYCVLEDIFISCHLLSSAYCEVCMGKTRFYCTWAEGSSGLL